MSAEKQLWDNCWERVRYRLRERAGDRERRRQERSNERLSYWNNASLQLLQSNLQHPHIFMMALVLTSACMFCPLEQQQQHQTNPLSTTNVDWWWPRTAIHHSSCKLLEYMTVILMSPGDRTDAPCKNAHVMPGTYVLCRGFWVFFSIFNLNL